LLLLLLCHSFPSRVAPFHRRGISSFIYCFPLPTRTQDQNVSVSVLFNIGGITILVHIPRLWHQLAWATNRNPNGAYTANDSCESLAKLGFSKGGLTWSVPGGTVEPGVSAVLGLGEESFIPSLHLG
jgi:hypothetical protein